MHFSHLLLLLSHSSDWAQIIGKVNTMCVSAALILRDDLFQMPVWKYAEELHREQLPVIEMPLDKYNMNEELFHAILRAFAERRSQNSHVLYWFPPQSERNLLLPALLL